MVLGIIETTLLEELKEIIKKLIPLLDPPFLTINNLYFI